MADDRERAGQTEPPTIRRLQKARDEGNVARAHGVAGAGVLLAGAVLLSIAGEPLVDRLELIVRLGLSPDPAAMRDPARMLAALAPVVAVGFGIIAVFVLVVAVAGFFADLAVGGWVFSAEPLAPDPSRIDPVAGFRRLFSHAAAVEMVKALVKFAVVVAVSVWLGRVWAGAFLHLAAATWPGAMRQAATGWSRMFVTMAVALAGVAALEIPYEIWAFRDRLKMTRQEVRDELREMEGSPQTKRRIRVLRHRLARLRMMSEVPKADVVIVNPEHYAAALRYRADSMRAPRLVAKGAGLVALRIRALAGKHEVPIVEAPRLARAICRYVELDEEIPTGLYPPVAEVLAHVYRLRAAQSAGAPPPPAPPSQRFEPAPEFAA
ncbi:MAG TPA: flagellar type III secretion system protein FlhB [Stellaceae bacterium]|nr:flagellar type III secretion system protein FlhB [Stellaceae bacterium]